MKRAEARIIGGLLSGGAKEFKIYSSYLSEDSFSDKRLKAVFNRIKSIVNSGDDFDIEYIANEFRGDPAITPAFLLGMMEIGLTPLSIPNSISLLNAEKFRAAIVEMAKRVQTVSARDMAEELQAEIWKYHSGIKTSWELGEALHRTLDRIESRMNGDTEYSYGIGELDRVLGGLYRKETTIIAARPGMGKSSLAINISNHQIEKGKKVLYIDLESGDEFMLERWITVRSGIGIKAIHHGHLADGQLTKIQSTAAALEPLPLVINDRAAITVGEIYNQGLDTRADIIIVDYINLMSGPESNEVDRLGEIARGLHEMAKNLNIPIIVVCQLNRGPETRTGNKPNIADLRGSGKLEEYADNIILLFWEHKYDSTQPENVSTAIIAKQKQGDVGEVKLYWDASKLKFGTLEGGRYDRRTIS